LLDAKIVLYWLHARDPFDQILGATLVVAAVNGSVQRHLAVAHLDVDVRGVEPAILGETVKDCERAKSIPCPLERLIGLRGLDDYLGVLAMTADRSGQAVRLANGQVL